MTFHGEKQGMCLYPGVDCCVNLPRRKVEGEGKGEAHGEGAGKADAVPMRRWEDWERSRLRKLRREERRRREFERAHPAGFVTGEGDLLAARADARSQYDGSDTVSMISSDDDHWGPQIGGYNEHNAQYPPPPVGLLIPQDQALQTAKTLGGAELEAMLESGFDTSRSNSPTGAPVYAPRYQLADGSSTQLAGVNGKGYAPLTRAGSPGAGTLNNPLSPTTPGNVYGADWRAAPGSNAANTGGQRGPGERYGPLGPLDPATRF